MRFYYDESREEHRRGNLREAEKGYRGVLQLDPGFAPARRDLGMIALARGSYKEAVTLLSETAKLLADSPDVHNSLGSALLQAGLPQDAVPILERAVALDPALAVAWYNLGGAYCLRGDFERAKAVQNRLRTLAPELARQLEALINRPP